MKETGIIRKIDDLGRIVIPKEIRKTLRIREGDPMEIYVEKNGEIILKRYAPFGDVIDQVISLAEVLSQNTGFAVCITDNQRVIAVSSKNKINETDKLISEELILRLEDRILYINRGDKPIKITDKDDKYAYLTQVISPIISEGNVIGSIIFFSETMKKAITEADLKLLQTATDFLSNIM